MLSLEIASILPSHWDFSHELHEDPDVVPIIVHEDVVDLVEVVRLLERDEFLLSATRSFQSIFENFFGHNQPGIRAFESPPLSVQESPNLFTFRVLSLNFLAALVTYVTANNGFHRSIMTHWRRRQTRRQAFFFGVIGSSSARIKERLTDGDVIVVEVFGEPLLGQGLLGVLDIRLYDEVVVGLITCGVVFFVQGTQLLSGSARACYPRH